MTRPRFALPLGSPLQLLLLACSFALAAYAGVRLLAGDWFGVALWIVGAALLHDLVLLPLYAVADRALVKAAGRRRDLVMYVRVPAALSGLRAMPGPSPCFMLLVMHATLKAALQRRRASTICGRMSPLMEPSTRQPLSSCPASWASASNSRTNSSIDTSLLSIFAQALVSGLRAFNPRMKSWGSPASRS